MLALILSRPYLLGKFIIMPLSNQLIRILLFSVVQLVFQNLVIIKAYSISYEKNSTVLTRIAFDVEQAKFTDILLN